MKTVILTPALALAALTLAACGPKTEAGNNTAAETVTLNDEGATELDNSGVFDAPANATATDNAADALGDNVTTGNAL